MRPGSRPLPALDDHQLLLGLKGLLMQSQEKKPELLNISLGPKKGVLSSLGGGANDLKYAEKVKELEEEGGADTTTNGGGTDTSGTAGTDAGSGPVTTCATVRHERPGTRC